MLLNRFRSPRPADVSADSAVPLWRIDQSAMMQGIPENAQRQMASQVAQTAEIWEKTQQLAAQQPIVARCEEAVCADIDAAVARLKRHADTLVVIGTGGASLGAQALCAFSDQAERVLFLENCDAHSAHTVLTRCNLARTAWVIISKSGETVETLAGTLALIAHYEGAGKASALATRVVVITSAGPRPLRQLAEHYGWPMLNHPSDIGGRFSVFSCVGLLPAAFAGMDIRALAATARSCWDQLLSTRDADLFAAANWFSASLPEQSLHVVMAYGDRLRAYTQWYKQLWAESLGKEGRGPTPVTAVGAIDQHSQLQLYLGGARDKLFTLILPDGQDAPVPLAKVDIPQISYLSAHTMQDIMHASAEATYATLRHNQLPVRMFQAPFSARSLCELMVRTMLETLLVAAILGVDPYSQPAVEEGKQRARRSLGLGDASHG